MFPKRLKRISPHIKQRGSMLVMALFVIVVLSLLGLAVVQVLSDSNKSTVYEVYGARAFNAANSGADHALADIFGPSVSGPTLGRCAAVNSKTYTLPKTAISGFSGCELVIECSEFTVNETGFTHYRVQSEARCNAGDFKTVRMVAVEARIR